MELELPWAQLLNLPCPGGSMLNKYWRSLFIPKIHPAGAAKCTLLGTQKESYWGGEGRISSLQAPSCRIWAAEQGSKGTLCASSCCDAQRGLRGSAQQCRVEHLLPLPAAAERQKLQDLNETEILILCYCIKFD